MIRLAFIAVLCATQTANALSCLAPDPLRQYIDARDSDSDDLFSLVIGKLTLKEPARLPSKELTGNGNDGTADTAAHLTGRALTSDGFTISYDEDVTLRLNCLSIWCAGVPTQNTDVFVALRHDGDARFIDLGPCPSNALPWTADDEARVLNCHRFGKCEASR